MLSIIIMLLVLIEALVAGSMILFFIKSRKNVNETNNEILLFKKEVINMLSEYRISIKMLNQQAKKIKDDQQTKQMLDLLNIITTATLIFGIKKKGICK